MKDDIQKIILKYTHGHVTAFLDDKGFSHLDDCVEEIANVKVRRTIHPTQADMLELTDEQLNGTLRDIGSWIGLDHPQKVKHHLAQLTKYGYLNVVGGKYVKAQ